MFAGLSRELFDGAAEGGVGLALDRAAVAEAGGVELELGELAKALFGGGDILREHAAERAGGWAEAASRLPAASPAKRTPPFCGQRNDRWPAVWPGVWIAFMPPAAGIESPSFVSWISEIVSSFGLMRSSSGPRRRPEITVLFGPGAGFSPRTIGASSGWTYAVGAGGGDERGERAGVVDVVVGEGDVLQVCGFATGFVDGLEDRVSNASGGRSR